MKELLYYDNIAEFNTQYYKDLLTINNLVPGKIEIKKMNLPDGQSDDEYNFRGWELRKADIRYLVSDTLAGKQVQIKDLLPIQPAHPIELGSKGLVFSHVKKPITAKFKSEQSMTFRELVNILSSFEHTNEIHQKLNWLMAIASLLLRFNYRLSTPPGFGKDSTVDILGNLMGGCGTIESPTLAKVEERANVLKWLAVNEVIDIRGEEWRVIEQFLLASGAHKPSITKHSRAHGGVGEVIDISKLSLSLLYNDITEYPKPEKYVDFVTKGAVLDRFPAMRFYGVLTEDFNKGTHTNNKQLVKTNLDKYKEIIYNLTYYKKNIQASMHDYDTSKLIKMPSRWKINIGRLLMVINVYSDTQDEFNSFINEINNSIEDYQAMLIYPKRVLELYSLMKVPSTVKERLKDLSLKDLEAYLREQRRKKNTVLISYQLALVKEIQVTKTFINKNALISAYNEPNAYEEKKDEFW